MARVVQLVGDLLNLKVTDLSVLEQTVQDVVLLELEGGAIDLLKLLYHRTLEQIDRSVVQGLEPDLIELALLKSEPFPIQTQNQAYQKQLPNSTWGWLGLGEEYMDYERLSFLSRSDLIASLDSRPDEYQDRKSQMLALRRSTFMLTENSSSLYPYYKIDSLLCISRNICRFRWSLTSKPSMRVDSTRLASEDPLTDFFTKQAEKNYKEDTEFKNCLKLLLKDARAIKIEEILSMKQLKPYNIAECLRVVHEGFGTDLELPKYTEDTRLNEFLPGLNQADIELLEKVLVIQTPESWNLKTLSDWFEIDYPIYLSSIQNGLKSTRELIALKLVLRLSLFLSLSNGKEPSSSLATSIILQSENIHIEIILECIRFAAIHKTKNLSLVENLLDALLVKEIPQPLAYVLLSVSSTLPQSMADKVSLVAYKTLFYPEIPISLVKLVGKPGKPSVVGHPASVHTSYFIETDNKLMIPLRPCTPRQLIGAQGIELQEQRRIFTLEHLLQQPEPSFSVTESQLTKPSSLDLPGTHYKFTWRGFRLDGTACPAEGILSVTCAGVFLSSVDADCHRTVAMQIPYSQIIDLKFDLQQVVLVVDIEDSNPKHVSLQVDCGLQISQDIVSYLVLQLRRPRKVAVID